MPDLRERWRTGWFEATAYDAVVERERLARVLGWLLWGMDAGGFYGDIDRLAGEPSGSAILDVPCGGGVAFRGLRADQSVRYVAADLSPVMLDRARREAQRRGLDQVEFVEADVESLPFEDRSFDLCISYTGLHCFPNPAAAVAEMGRVVRRDGALRGTCVVKRAGPRQDAAIRLMQRGGVFGPCGTATELESWLTAAGMVDVEVHRDGALAYFSGRRPS